MSFLCVSIHSVFLFSVSIKFVFVRNGVTPFYVYIGGTLLLLLLMMMLTTTMMCIVLEYISLMF